MITETLRILSDWSKHATYGVNALLSSVPRETDVALPGACDIRNATVDAQTALRQIPDDLTGAGILWTAFVGADSVNPVVKPWPPDTTFDVLARITVADADTPAGLNTISVISRALMRNVGQIMTTSAGESARTLRQVQLYAIKNIRHVEFYLSANDTQLTRGVMLTVSVRDTFASP